jgi:paraquat-inducible protein B
MSKPVSPVAIGGFTVGALAVLVTGLLLFGGGQFFNTDKIRYVIFFDTSSLNGLDVGAPVKMQGVKIGTVTEISLQVDPSTGMVLKPVVVEIDRRSFLGPGGMTLTGGISHEQQLKSRDMLVEKGFRARLETQSLLTGLLFVDFDKHPETPARFTGVDYQGLIELPYVPTTVDVIRNIVDELVKNLRNLPLDEMVRNFADTLKDIHSLVGSEDMKKSNAALTKTLEGMEKTVAALNRNLEPLLRETHQTVRDANGLVQDSRAMVQDVHQGMKPLMAATEKTLGSATAALDKAKSAVGTVEGALGPDSTLNETLIALRNAARSLRDLTDFLERHPEALISGKNH